jgi:homocitrate synthase
MCTSCNGDDASNGHANGTTATNGTANGTSHEGFTPIPIKSAPRPLPKSAPYAAVGDFLSNVGRFKIIGTSCNTCACLSSKTFSEARELSEKLLRRHTGYWFRVTNSCVASERDRRSARLVSQLV